MSSSPLGLPLVPPELKQILPYLHRADELKKQDPIISYWCTYYAAQLGISFKARDNPSRDLLFSLLGVLEKMKADIGPSDAIDIESVSSAYVEHFALKVFANADNEDRSGNSTKSTAKKFLAASNFLQVLSAFPKTSVSDSTEEKIRYAKWKATDIAKAFREGRRPAPGPPGWAEEQDDLKQGHEDSILTTDISYPADHHHSSVNPATGWIDPPPTSTWSMAGSHDSGATFSHIGNSTSSTRMSEDLMRLPSRGGTGAHTIDAFSGSARGPLKKPAWTNEELEGKYTPPTKTSMKSGSPDSDKRAHFSPTTPDALPSPTRSNSPPKVYSGPENIYAPSTSIANYVGYSPLPPPPTNVPYSYVPLMPRDSPHPVVYPSAPLPEPFELTPDIISKAQKRCRYAISALDYEDAETARKQLREALALLDG